ncbi:MAG: DUF4157 domain-containing protein [Deltaproteobacteria bacterium]|nr:DUF4157 domain-containing protein [Deltaproteobacteria bacterium]
MRASPLHYGPPRAALDDLVSGIVLGDAERARLDATLAQCHLHMEAAARAPLQLRAEGPAQPRRDAVTIARAGLAGAGAPLPFRERIQAAFGRHDVSGIRAHTGAAAADANARLGALGFAMGEAVAFRGAPGLFTAAHEAAHVVQQRAGVRLSDGVGRAGDAYERHADEVARVVCRGGSAESLLDRFAGGRGPSPGGSAVQLQEGDGAAGPEGAVGSVVRDVRSVATAGTRRPTSEILEAIVVSRSGRGWTGELAERDQRTTPEAEIRTLGATAILRHLCGPVAPDAVGRAVDQGLEGQSLALASSQGNRGAYLDLPAVEVLRGILGLGWSDAAAGDLAELFRQRFYDAALDFVVAHFEPIMNADPEATARWVEVNHTTLAEVLTLVRYADVRAGLGVLLEEAAPPSIEALHSRLNLEWRRAHRSWTESLGDQGDRFRTIPFGTWARLLRPHLEGFIELARRVREQREQGGDDPNQRRDRLQAAHEASIRGAGRTVAGGGADFEMNLRVAVNEVPEGGLLEATRAIDRGSYTWEIYPLDVRDAQPNGPTSAGADAQTRGPAAATAPSGDRSPGRQVRDIERGQSRTRGQTVDAASANDARDRREQNRVWRQSRAAVAGMSDRRRLHRVMNAASILMAPASHAVAGINNTITRAVQANNEVNLPFELPGVYAVRCLAQPLDVQRQPTRPPSVAVAIIEVFESGQQAREWMDEPDAAVAESEAVVTAAQRAGASDGELGALRAQAHAAEVFANGTPSAVIELQITRLEEQRRQHPDRAADLTTQIDALRQQLAHAREQEQTFGVGARRLRALIVDEEGGDRLDLLLSIGPPVAQAGRWLATLMDSTTANGARYTAFGATATEAQQNVVRAFAAGNTYGIGRLHVRFPQYSGARVPDMALDNSPAGGRLFRNRLNDVGTVIAIPAALGVPGLGQVAMAAGAVTAAANVYDRLRNHTFRLDAESVNDLITLFTTAVSLGRMAGSLGNRLRMARIQGTNQFRIVAEDAVVLLPVRGDGALASVERNLGRVQTVIGSYQIMASYADIARQEAAGTISHARARVLRAEALSQFVTTSVAHVIGEVRHVEGTTTEARTVGTREGASGEGAQGGGAQREGAQSGGGGARGGGGGTQAEGAQSGGGGARGGPRTVTVEDPPGASVVRRRIIVIGAEGETPVHTVVAEVRRLASQGQRERAMALAAEHGLDGPALLHDPPRIIERPTRVGGETSAAGARVPEPGPDAPPEARLRHLAVERGPDGRPTERARIAREALRRHRRSPREQSAVAYEAALRRIAGEHGPAAASDGSSQAAAQYDLGAPALGQSPTAGLEPPAAGAPAATVEQFVRRGNRQDLLRYWLRLRTWSEGMRIAAGGLSAESKARLQAVRQELFDAADAHVRARISAEESPRQLAGSTGVTSDMDPTYQGPRTLEATRLFVEGFEQALRERGVTQTEGWMDIFGINPYSDPQLARFRISENTPEAQGARDRLLGGEALLLEVQRYQHLMAADPTGARWRRYVEEQFRSVERTHASGDAGEQSTRERPATSEGRNIAGFYERVETAARAADRSMIEQARRIRPELAGRSDPEVLALLRSHDGFLLMREARARLLADARASLQARIAEGGAAPTIEQREAILRETSAVKALEEEAYNLSAIQSVVEGQQEGHQMRVEAGQSALSQPDMDPIARQNALVDSLNMIEVHMEQVRAMVAAAMRPVPGESRTEASQRRARQINDAMKPIAKYLARALIEARELGIPLNSDDRVVAAMAQQLRARVGDHVGAGGDPRGRSGATMSVGEAEQIVIEATGAGLMGDGNVNMNRFLGEVQRLDSQLRRSISNRRALPDAEARAMTPNADSNLRAARPSEPTSSPNNRAGQNPRNRPRIRRGGGARRP